MGITASSEGSGLGKPCVALAKLDAETLGQAHEGQQRLQVKPPVGRIGNRFGQHCRVHRDALQRRGFDRSGIKGGIDPGLEHLGQAVWTDTFAPARHGARIDRHLGLEELEAAEYCQ